MRLVALALCCGLLGSSSSTIHGQEKQFASPAELSAALKNNRDREKPLQKIGREEIPRLIEIVLGDDLEARSLACEELVGFQEAAHPHVLRMLGPLLDLLHDLSAVEFGSERSKEQRNENWQIEWLIQSTEEKGVGFLRGILTDPQSPTIRKRHAVRLLNGMNSDVGLEAIHDLLDLLDVESDPILGFDSEIQNAFQALGDKVIAPLRSIVMHPGVEPADKLRAIRALSIMDSHPGPEAIPVLLELHRHDSEDPSDLDWNSPVSLEIERAITSQGTKAVEPLRRVLRKSQTDGTELFAISLLGSIGSPAAKAVPELVAFLGHSDSQFEWAAIETLFEIGPAARAAVPELVDAAAARFGDRDVAHLIRTITRLGWNVPEARDILQRDLAGADAGRKRFAACGLSFLGLDSDRSVALLADDLRYGSSRWPYQRSDRDISVAALGRYGSDAAPAVPVLLNAYRRSPNLNVFWALGQIDPDGFPLRRQATDPSSPLAKVLFALPWSGLSSMAWSESKLEGLRSALKRKDDAARDAVVSLRAADAAEQARGALMEQYPRSTDLSSQAVQAFLQQDPMRVPGFANWDDFVAAASRRDESALEALRLAMGEAAAEQAWREVHEKAAESFELTEAEVEQVLARPFRGLSAVVFPYQSRSEYFAGLRQNESDAVTAFRQLVEETKAGTLGGLLDGSDRETHLAVVQLLSCTFVSSAQELPEYRLVACLDQSEDARLRRAALRYLYVHDTESPSLHARIEACLEDPDPWVRLEAANTLVIYRGNAASDQLETPAAYEDRLKRIATVAVPVLLDLLDQGSLEIKRSATEALRSFPFADAALPALFQQFKTATNRNLRRDSLLAIRDILLPARQRVPYREVQEGPRWGPLRTAPEIRNRLRQMSGGLEVRVALRLQGQDTSELEREELVRFPTPSDERVLSDASKEELANAIVKEVRQILSQGVEQDAVILETAAGMLASLPADQVVIAELIAVASDQSLPGFVREPVITRLGELGAEAKSVIPTLLSILREPKPVSGQHFQTTAARALARIAPKNMTREETEQSFDAVFAALRQYEPTVPRRPDEPIAISMEENDLLGALSAFAQDFKDRDRNLSEVELKMAIGLLDDAKVTLKRQGHGALRIAEIQDDLQRQLELKEREMELQRLRQRPPLLDSILPESPLVRWLVVGLPAYVLLAAGVWSVLLLVRPLWLLKINEAMRPFRIQVKYIENAVSLRVITLAALFNWNDLVLQAWVQQHLEAARENFAQRKVVRDRKVHVAIPVECEGATSEIEELRASLFRRGRSQCRVLIWGEGGSGKTSLAIQFAKWAMDPDVRKRLAQHFMLPVLIDNDRAFAASEEGDPFHDCVRGHLQALIGAETPISEELFQQLMRRRHVLVIVDRLSEMSAEARELIRPSHPNFLANALIVTSRVNEHLEDVPRTTIRPIRIAGDYISDFVGSYLKQLGKRSLFPDNEYFDLCRGLTLLVGKRNITVLFAKLYADQAIAAKDQSIESLPDNLPDLMLTYLNWLNRNAKEEDPDNRSVQRDAHVIAWECLKETFRPSTAKLDTVMDSLRHNGQDEIAARERLSYLEDRIQLVETVGPAESDVRIVLDPLSEYLAALELIRLSDDEAKWFAFLEKINALPGKAGGVKGFLQAVRDCLRERDVVVPDIVLQAVERFDWNDLERDSGDVPVALLPAAAEQV